MKTALALLAVLLLTACNTAGTGFQGVPATRMTVDGSVFDVRVRGDRAEAIRVNAQYAPRFGPVRARAAFAMAEVSGCKVSRIDGDQARAVGRLGCSGRRVDWRGPEGLRSYTCFEVARWTLDNSGFTYSELDCAPD